MPANQFRRAPAAAAIAIAFGLGLGISAPAEAAGLGRLNVQSGLGQPLRAELELSSVSPDEAPTLSAKLAPLATYRAANVEFSPGLSALRFTLEQRNGTYVVRISSPQPINEPYLDLLVELSWATGRVVREYTVLLDPPALRSQPEVIAPAVPRATAPAAPQAAAPAPAATQAPAAAPAPAAPAATKPAAAASAAAGSYTVKRGDTLTAVAEGHVPPSASLDQMLVALFRANPAAFAGNNMNRLNSGAVLAMPAPDAVTAVPAGEATREVRAHSADFAAYRDRLAKAASGTPSAAAPAPAAAGGGQISAKVEDKSAAARPGGDQLKIAKAADGKTAAAAASADEAAARAREVKELETRLAQLTRTNEELKKAIELQSKAGTQAQKQADAKTAPAAAAPAPAAAPEASKPEVAAPAAAPAAEASAPQPEVAKPAAPVKPEAAKPAPAPAPVEEPPGFFSELLGNTSTQLGLGGIGVLLAGLFGWSAYRRKKAESQAAFHDGGDALGSNSLFGQTGGQSVDTAGTASTFNSSFMPPASPLDSNEVDPVAEADVYIAYGREEQAEDILKEALRQQPDRPAVRGKLLEIYAARGDKASFNAVANELHERSAGMGEEWEQAVKLGRSLDPGNPLYAATGMTGGLAAAPITQLRIPPQEVAAPAAQSELSDILAPTAMPGIEPITEDVPPLTRMAVDAPAAAAPGGTTLQPLEFAPAAPAPEPEAVAPMTMFSMDLDEPEPAPAPAPAPVAPAAAADAAPLDFDLGRPTGQPVVPVESPAPITAFDMPGIELPEPAAAETAGLLAAEAIEPVADALHFDLDLDIPSVQPVPAPAPAAPAAPDMGLSDFEHTMPPLEQSAHAGLPAATLEAIADIDLDLDLPPAPPPARSADELLGQPTLAGIMGALPDDLAQRVGGSETDMATVPLIDFDLSAATLDAGARSAETEPGSALAQQMATKLDLARGYIDLGVRDGARELLEEVMREGTREQREAAVDLIKQIEP